MVFEMQDSLAIEIIQVAKLKNIMFLFKCFLLFFTKEMKEKKKSAELWKRKPLLKAALSILADLMETCIPFCLTVCLINFCSSRFRSQLNPDSFFFSFK